MVSDQSLMVKIENGVQGEHTNLAAFCHPFYLHTSAIHVHCVRDAGGESPGLFLQHLFMDQELVQDLLEPFADRKSVV